MNLEGLAAGLEVLAAPDKFKGSTSAAGVAGAIRRGWLRVRPNDTVRLLPISDGGDGFGELLGGHMEAVAVRTRSLNAAGRPCVVKWWWEPRSRTAVIESARAIGLAMLPKGRMHPFDLDTRGLAPLLRAAAARKPRRCIVGVGGSATNDGGFGLACGLGWRFENARGKSIESWTALRNATVARPPSPPLGLGELIVAVDVNNPLLGAAGCSRIYGPQKGLGARDFAVAEGSLEALVNLMRGWNISIVPGAGAAGGLGFGLAAFCGASIVPGFEIFADATGLPGQVHKADLVITGEGGIDESTFMGKGVGLLVGLCARSRTKCFAIGGRVSPGVRDGFAAVASLAELAGESEALRRPGVWIARAAMELARSA